ncbi:MAG: PfkB family carbohydrate kinase [Planctomycetaceae bacterium]
MAVSTQHDVKPPRPVVAGLGLVVLDEQMFVQAHPAVDAKVFADGCRMQVGGPAPTALAQLQRFGVGTKVLGAWATDAAGRAIEDGLSAAGISFDATSCRTANATGAAHVWVESTTGRRTVVSYPPDGRPEPSSAAEFARSARLLHLDGWGGDAAIAAAEATRSQGGVITFDSGSVKPSTERLLRLANVVNAPLRFLNDFCGTRDPEAGAKTLLGLGPRLVTVTDGEQGAGVYTQDVARWQPAFQVRPVDTCGAGDVFCGGLIFSVLAGYEPEATLLFAMATATLKISRPGNREALAGYDEVVSFLESRRMGQANERRPSSV